MSHKVETMAYAGQTPWHSLGFKVSDDLTPEQMLKAAKIDWTVSKQKVKLADDNIIVPGKYGLVRDSDKSILSMVGKTYKPVQNIEAMSFFDKFIKAGHMTMETAGSLDHGRYVWALAKIGAEFNIGRSDKIEGYLLLASPHVHGKALLIQTTAIRVVCWNTLTYAVGADLKGKGTRFRMPHSMKFDDKVKDAAEKALGLATEQITGLKEVMTKLAGTKAKPDDVDSFFYDVLRLDEETFQKVEAEEKREPKNIARFQHALTHAPGQQLATAKGTWWGAVNAVTYVVDHEMAKTREIGLRNAWVGHTAAMKRRAVNLALDRVG